MRLEERTHAGYIEGLERARRVCEAFIRECGERFFVEEAHSMRISHAHASKGEGSPGRFDRLNHDGFSVDRTGSFVRG